MNKLELPEKFSLSMREMIKDEYSLFIDSLSLPPSVSIRKNIQKSCSLGV